MNTRTRPRVRAVNLRKPAAPFSAQARAQPARLETAPGTGIADPVKFRERIRLNRAIARTAAVSDRDELAEFERIIGSDDLLPFYVLELGARLGTAVCKLGFDDEEDGTGFLLGPDVLLTNHHVLPDPARARLARCIFEYQLGVDRKPKETIAFRLDPDSLFITSPAETGLDYTFVRIDAAAAIRFGQIPASRGSFGSLQGEYAHVVQHPAGKMKRVTYRDNRIYEDDGLFIRYTADTEPGSSGSPVFNNDWQLIGLHHRSRRITQAQIDAEPELARYQYLNQAIKLSAVASDLENRLQGDAKLAAREVLRCFGDTDSLLGYFGALGRPLGPGSDFEKVVQTYQGEAHDIDVGFWNIEWFTNRFEEKTPEIAKIFAELNLDIYGLSESSPAAADHLVRFLAQHYGLEFAWAASEPDAGPGKQSTTVLWNTQTVEGEPVDWPDEVRPWFEVDSRHFDELGLEAVHGKVFNRHPGLFRFKALQPRGDRRAVRLLRRAAAPQGDGRGQPAAPDGGTHPGRRHQADDGGGERCRLDRRRRLQRRARHRRLRCPHRVHGADLGGGRRRRGDDLPQVAALPDRPPLHLAQSRAHLRRQGLCDRRHGYPDPGLCRESLGPPADPGAPEPPAGRGHGASSGCGPAARPRRGPGAADLSAHGARGTAQ